MPKKICLTTFDTLYEAIYLFQKRDICVGIEGVSGLGVDLVVDLGVGLAVGWVSGVC